MLPRPHRLRRARRSDFDAIWTLLIQRGSAAPGEPDRATLRRFRRVIADLGADLYVAVADDRPLGLVHVTYARRLAGPPEARLELLVAGPPGASGDDTARALMALATDRARRRGCMVMRCVAGAPAVDGAALERLGWRRAGDALQVDLAERAQ
jgi:GNAT superfamily N-acetyltransferase